MNPGFTGNLKQQLIALILCVAGFLYYLSFIDAKHDWGDDFAQYILHAQNILDGKEYSLTGYIFNPHNANIGPVSYPPVFPLLLCIPISFFGSDILIIKAFIALLFSSFLFIIFRLCYQSGSEKFALWMIPLMGLNPFILKFLQEIMSDLPFLFFVYLSFYFIWRSQHNKPFVIVHSILAGVLVALAAGTRVTGFLIIGVLLYHAYINRKNTLRSSLPLLSFLLISVLFRILYPDTGSGYPLEINAHDLIKNIKDIAIAFVAFLGGGSYYLSLILSLLSIVCIPYGIYHTRNEFRIPALIFILLYMILFVIWGAKGHGIRLLLPVIPLALIFYLQGLEKLSAKYRLNSALTCSILAILFLLNYHPALSEKKHFNSDTGPFENDARNMFAAVKELVPKEDTIAFFKPRTMAYFTSHPSIGLDKSVSYEMLIKNMKNRGVKYFVSSPFDPEDIKRYAEKISGNAIWEQEDYRIFKLD